MHTTHPPKKKLYIIGIDYSPAELQKGSGDEWRIVFYVKSLTENKLVRIRKRVKRIQGKTERLKYANKIISEINLKLAQGWNPLLENENVSAFNLLRDCLQEFKDKLKKKVADKSLRPDTERAYVSYVENIKRFLSYKGKMDMFVINYNKSFISDVLDYIYYDRENSPTTRNNHLQFMIIIGNYFVEKGYIVNNPAAGFTKLSENDKVRQFIPKEVRTAIRDHLSNKNPNYLCLCMMTYYCFFRRTELTKLKIQDLRLAKGIIVIKSSQSKNSKTEKAVTIPEGLLTYLISHVKSATDDMFIFSKDNFKPGHGQLPPKKISDEWDRLRNALKLPSYYQFYGLKDTGITELLDQGMPSFKVQRQARHSDLKMTEKYISSRHYDIDQEIFKSSGSF
jgi:integrase/recombinase XerD